jgi:cellobiose epimerase
MDNRVIRNLISIPIVLLILFPLSPVLAKGKDSKQTAGIETSKKVILAELKEQLKVELDHFGEATIDTVYGGYFTDMNYKWELEGRQTKMIVTQARLVWANANASLFYKQKEPYYRYARHGFEFLKNVMWDKVNGGFYDLVDREGKPLGFHDQFIKTAYGNGFAIYGLAAYYKAFGDTSALNLAIRTYKWMDEHSYDPKYGGYFQNMSREGVPFKEGLGPTPPKDQNSMIHIMEAFTELYQVWPNAELRVRLDSLFHDVRDIAIGDHPYLTLFFKRDWTPISYRDSNNYLRTSHFEQDHISFGHNVETAWLLLETSKALGFKNDTKTLGIAKWMDDYALENGWDRELGGIYDGGYIFQGEKNVTIIMPTKQWWAEIEALNSFLMMSELYPHDKMDYYTKFCEQWNYIKKYVLDNKYGGWYWGGIDKAPQNEKGPKATIWKVDYHTTRGLINCILRLEGRM